MCCIPNFKPQASVSVDSKGLRLEPVSQHHSHGEKGIPVALSSSGWWQGVRSLCTGSYGQCLDQGAHSILGSITVKAEIQLVPKIRETGRDLRGYLRLSSHYMKISWLLPPLWREPGKTKPVKLIHPVAGRLWSLPTNSIQDRTFHRSCG